MPRGASGSGGESGCCIVGSAGAACARGPLSIILPYHRVIRSDGSIGMYGELGTERKRRLLALEGIHAR